MFGRSQANRMRIATHHFSSLERYEASVPITTVQRKLKSLGQTQSCVGATSMSTDAIPQLLALLIQSALVANPLPTSLSFGGLQSSQEIHQVC